jgi:hypothetical protein
MSKPNPVAGLDKSHDVFASCHTMPQLVVAVRYSRLVERAFARECGLPPSTLTHVAIVLHNWRVRALRRITDVGCLAPYSGCPV